MQRRWLLRISKGFGAAPKVLPAHSTSGHKRSTGRTSSANRAASISTKAEDGASDMRSSSHLDEHAAGPIRASRTRAEKQDPSNLTDEDQRVEAIIAAHPALQIRADADGNGNGSIALVTTLERLACATRLRVDDVSFALAECGLLRLKVTTPDVVALEPFGIDSQRTTDAPHKHSRVKVEPGGGTAGSEDDGQSIQQVPFDVAALAQLEGRAATGAGEKLAAASAAKAHHHLGQPTPLLEPALLLTRDMVRAAIKARNVKRPVLDEIYVLV